MLSWSILQYSVIIYLENQFLVFFFSGCLRQVSLYGDFSITGRVVFKNQPTNENSENRMCPLAKPKSKGGHNSVIILQMISKFHIDLYFTTLLYPSVNYERNLWISSKVTDQNSNVWPVKTQVKKGDNLVKIFQMISQFNLELYLTLNYILQCFILLITLNKIDTSLQKLLV